MHQQHVLPEHSRVALQFILQYCCVCSGFRNCIEEKSSLLLNLLQENQMTRSASTQNLQPKRQKVSMFLEWVKHPIVLSIATSTELCKLYIVQNYSLYNISINLKWGNQRFHKADSDTSTEEWYILSFISPMKSEM